MLHNPTHIIWLRLVRSQQSIQARRKRTMAEDGAIPSAESNCGCEIRCGCCRTKRLSIGRMKWLNNPKGALFFLSLVAFLQASVSNGFYNVNVSTLERRFSLRSYETGFIASMYDLAVCFATPVFAYIGGAGHKPLWMGSGAFLSGLGSTILALPHFLIPEYTVSNVTHFNCETEETCEETSLRSYRFLFVFGQILLGAGGASVQTLALTYIDENVSQSQSSMYHGIYFAAMFIGPGVGFILGGYFLTKFTTLEPDEGISVDHPLWIGSWWLGFLLVGFLLMILSLAIFLFPEKLPGTEHCRANREAELHQVNEQTAQESEDFGKSTKDFPRNLRIILKNPILMVISFSTAIDVGMTSALAVFGPKHLESQFSIPASNAAFSIGLIGVTICGAAHLISGFIISKLKLTVRSMLRINVMWAFAAFCFLFGYFSTCDNNDIAGVHAPYKNETTITCEETKCGCTTSLYRPVCGSDNLTYLSYCDAGCVLTESKLLENCTRVDDTAKDGFCNLQSCSSYGIFLLLFSLYVLFTVLASQNSLQSSLRVVPFSQRSFTLGVRLMIIRGIGGTPFPIIYGKLLDMSCLVWGMECGECGSCHVYHNRSMATSLALLNLSFKGINVALCIAANFLYKPPPENKVCVDQESPPAEDQEALKSVASL